MRRAGGKPFGFLALACILAAGTTSISSEAAPVPVIIDTDVGDDVDDAFALVLALSDPRLEVLGITTAWGDTHARTLLVRRLLAALGRSEVPVAEGPATASTTPFTQRQWALGATDRSPAPDAVDLIRSTVRARPGAVTLVALAPLSNVAALLARDPDGLRGLKAVAIMAGSLYAGYYQGGSIPSSHPDVEYNVASAPRAFAALLGAGVAVQLFPLDSTQIKFDEVRRDRLFAYGSPASDALTLLYHQWRLMNAWGQVTPTLFDVVPVAWLLDPGLCPLVPRRLEVDDKGYTRPVPGLPNAQVCLTLDESATQRLIIETLAPQPRRSLP